jgi:spermidine synthase
MRMRWFFTFFFFSGFCSLLYEVIWVRLGMAHFGVTTPVVSIFLSLFMAGLGLGSWIAGRWMRSADARGGSYPLRLYALVELLIGFSAWAVPMEMGWAKSYLQNSASDLSASSLHYYWIVSLWIISILLPWCTCMGATFPLAMAAMRKLTTSSQRSFSFLYLANVLGAVVGALLPAFVLIELFGFRGTMKLAAVCNVLISVAAFSFSFRAKDVPETARAEAVETGTPASSSKLVLTLLFLTGMVSLAMEVVWIRQFTPYMGTEVYAFALILGCYLLGTFAGSQIYRRWLRRHRPGDETAAWFLLGLAGLAPLLMSDPRFEQVHIIQILRVALGIMPITALMGFVTPMLVDQYSEGNPERAGRAYAVNVVGCIVGPLLSGFLLLPYLGERWSLVGLSLPLFALLYVFRPVTPVFRKRYGLRFYIETAAISLALIAFTRDNFTIHTPREVRRDYAATVVAAGTGINRQLFVNGVGITKLTPITKMMAHLPLAFHKQPPKDALVICFGMGTTYRSLLSWGIPSTVVELLPSVPQVFEYFHPDAPQVLQSPNSHVIIDDGRLYLEKTREQFDVITIDPPPPTSAAGVSLLYSQEFYEVVKRRLRPGGILQQFTIGDDALDLVAMAKALRESFPYVRCLISVEGWGCHFLASMSPIPDFTAEELASHLPASAVADLLEWGPGKSAVQQFDIALSHEVSMDLIVNGGIVPIRALHDDRPVNEYFWLRSTLPRKWAMPLLRMSARWPD